MNPNIPFTIYNAAAGAGKTYTLVKAYLITVLKGEFRDSYKNILAITFTNKAVAEMKTRVLENLVAISSTDTPIKYQGLLDELVLETKIPKEKLKLKAKRTLKSILHNYAAFDIVTIDTFTHRVLRTFAYDLGIPMNFEIEMDSDALIEEAVAGVVSKIGVDKELTKLIIDFALSKLDEDKSWDITLELNKVARLLFSENDREHLNKLSKKKIADFEAFKKLLIHNSKELSKAVVSESKSLLVTINENGLATEDFTRGSIPKHFQKLAAGETAVDFKPVWKQDITNATFYGAKLEEDKKSLIDKIRPEIEETFLTTKQQLVQIQLLKNIIKNLTPLSVLNTINQELIKIKKERRILLISEFNTIISNTIKDQPAPFIYERLGERYRDYFIDEFQDTSELQWNNLIPLIDNAVSTETLSGKRGQVTIVGDAKQAIYRWRGGKAEQFIDLSFDKNPFSVQEKQVLNLPRNYRSHEEIIKFNNNFFTFLSGEFSDENHRQLYLQGNQQKVNSKKDGYVNISFIDAANAEEENEIYPEKVLESIIELIEKGYRANDICIIVRKQKEGAVLADFLSEKGLSIISSETLLINNDPQVGFIIDLLSWFTYPEDFLAKANVLHFLIDRLNIQDKHSFLQKMMIAKKDLFLLELRQLGINFDFDQLALRPLYDAVEYIVSSFNLANVSPAYIQFFLDVVFAFTQKQTDGIIGFLSYWDDKKEKLSIVAPETEEAIKIMTIHKAKGLEFPCVIYPYANIDVYREIEPKTWLNVDKDVYSGFEEVFIDYNKNISEYGSFAQKIIQERQAQLELDTFNLLYVVLTRAREQLYIISKYELSKKGDSNPNKFSGKLIKYLQEKGDWIKDEKKYEFGNPLKPKETEVETEHKAKAIKLSRFDDVSKVYKVNIVTNSGKLWDTAQKDAIEKGNLIHELMASIYTYDDINRSIEDKFVRGEITFFEKDVLKDEIKNVVKHPKLFKYFSSENKVYNERDIIYNGRLFRPDRITIDKEGLTSIIDYKTGIYSDSHADQINEYGNILQEMGHVIENKILIYFDESVTLKYI